VSAPQEEPASRTDTRRVVNAIAKAISERITPGWVFVLHVLPVGRAEGEKPRGIYVSNANRAGVISSLRELLKMLEDAEAAQQAGGDADGT